MWSEGVIGIPTDKDGEYISIKYWVKHFDEPSKFGIDNGRISKLMLKIDGKPAASYDRGWDICPESYAAEAALAILLKEFN